MNMKNKINVILHLAFLMKKSTGFIWSFKTSLTSLILVLSIMSTSVWADVELPRGEYHNTVDDLVVKVMGGTVRAQRTWYKGKWHHTRAWNSLEIEYDNLDGTVKSVSRNNNSFSGGLSTSFTNKIRITQTIEKKDTGGYRWFDKEGNWIDYDDAGNIVKYGDKNNVEVSFIYNTNKQRIGIKDHFGVQRLWYEYNADGTVSSVRDNADPAQAREVKYNYTNGLITSVVDVRGNSWNYEYAVFIEGSDTQTILNSTGGTGGAYSSDLNLQNATAHLIKVTDAEGRATHIKYFPSGRTESVTKADGSGVFYKFDYNKTKKEYYTQQKYSSGRINENWYNKDGDIIRRDVNGTTIETVTINGRIYTNKNELGFESIRELDEFDNLTKVVNADKTSRSYIYNTQYSLVTQMTDERGIKTKYDYDAKGNFIQLTEALGTPEQRITTYRYDEYGNLLEEKRLADSVTAAATITNSYDDNGNRLTQIKSVTATQNNTINYDSYNNQGNLLKWRDGRGKVWQQTFNKAGQRTSTTDPLKQVTQFIYDKANQLTAITNALNKTTRIAYDANARMEKIIDPYLSEKRLVYDSAGQLITNVDEEGYQQSLGYDTQGRRSQQTDAAGNTTAFEYGVNKATNVVQRAINAINFPTFRQEYAYDNRGRVIQTIDKLSDTLSHNSTRRYDAVGNITSSTDAEGKVTKYAYDSLNRLVKITYPDLTTSQYRYDNRDNLITVTNENQVVIRTYAYDHKNRLISETWPTGKTTYSSYDANDNLIQSIDNKAQLTKNQFDAANRLVQTRYFTNASATTADKTVSFRYNAANTLTGYNDGVTSASYTVDDLQRKTAETVNFGAFSKTLQTSFYKNSQKKSFTGAKNIINNYIYDSGNRLSQISLPNEGSIIINKYQWNSPEKITYPGGLTRTTYYDPLMRMTRINNSDSASNSLMNYTYAYDKVGNIKSKTTEHGAYNYDYDDRYRLTTVDNPTVATVSNLIDEAFSYDNAGNRLTDSSTTGNWNYNTTNQLTAYENITIEYDFNGNTIKKTKAGVATHFNYNTQNRLEYVKDNSNVTIASYYYDPFGRRLYKETNGSRTYFMYAEEGLVAELDNAGNVTQSYGYTPQSTYGTSPLYTKTNAGYAYYQLDHLGTPQQLVNKTGQVVWKAKSKSFGETFVEVNTVTNNLRFPGQYYDAETGLHYNYFRDYEPSIGRYLESDPIGLLGGLNVYGYVGGNPVYWSDPFGLKVYIDIYRDICTNNTITGSFDAYSDVTGSLIQGFTLEDRKAGDFGNKDPIRLGEYDAFIREDRDPRKIELRDVEDFENIQLHIGNDVDDVNGCFAVGTTRRTDKVETSRDKMMELLDLIDNDGSDDILVRVLGLNRSCQ